MYSKILPLWPLKIIILHYYDKIFPDSHFGSFYPQNLVWDSSMLGEMVLSDVT